MQEEVKVRKRDLYGFGRVWRDWGDYGQWYSGPWEGRRGGVTGGGVELIRIILLV